MSSQNAPNRVLLLLLILKKITKFVGRPTRCQILKIKCTTFNFSWGSAPDPIGGAYSASPYPLAGFKGPTSIEREGKGWEWERKDKERGGKEREGKKGRETEGGSRREEAPIEIKPP